MKFSQRIKNGIPVTGCITLALKVAETLDFERLE